MEDYSSYAHDFGIQRRSILLFFLLIGIGCIAGGLLWLQSGSTSNQKTQSSVPVESFAPKQKLVFDVQGAVNKPGVQSFLVSFGEHIRIQDLIDRADGFRKDADAEYISKTVNLATTVNDGYKLYVPKIGETKSIEAGSVLGSATGEGVSINTASKEALMGLKGIGEARASSIIEHRPYTTLEDVAKKASIPQSILETNSTRIRF